MNAFAAGGETSFNIAKTIMDIMRDEKVRDDWMVFTHYNTIPPKTATGNIKTIYLAYDSETKVENKTIWDEMKHFDSSKPELIICVDKTSYKFYKKQGLTAEYIPIGYDDLKYKEVNVPKKYGVGFIGSIDEDRNSIFHERHMFVQDLIKLSNIYYPNVGNQIPYINIHEEYSKCVVGFNDIILGINQRCFEIPVAGACMLVNEQIRKPINKDYPLKENTHYKVFTSFSDFLLKAKDMLDDQDDTITLKHPFSKGVIKVIDKWKMR